jgi:hypothetical protein
VILWPRLPLPIARTRAASLLGAEFAELEERAGSFDGPPLYAPTGGVRIDQSALRRLRSELIDVARSSGYPVRLTRNATPDYDRQTMECLVDAGMPIGEGLRPETWAWMAVMEVPQLVLWRWPPYEDRLRLERFAGPLYRNGLGRLWYQGVALDMGRGVADRWRLTSALGADQQVALFERPGLCASPHVARQIAEGWLRVPGNQRTEEVFRQAMKHLIVRAAVRRLDLLSADPLNEVIDSAFGDAARRRESAA